MTQITAQRKTEDMPGGSRSEAVASSGSGGGIRAAVASFWLAALFRVTAVAPGIARAVRPIFAWLAFSMSRHMQAATAANARRIFHQSPLTPKEERRFGRRVVANFYDFVCDVGRSVRATREELLARINDVDGLERWHAARKLRKGAIVVTAHIGSFEVGMAALAQYERRIHVVFKRDRFDAFERLRATMHRRLGIEEAAIDDGWSVWVRLRNALVDRDEVVAIQGDRIMPGQKGVRVHVPLLGGHLMLPSGPVKLALASGAPIVPILAIRTTGDKLHICIEEPIFVASEDAGGGGASVDEAMQKLADILARHIAARPDQWLVLERAFCEDAADAAADTGGHAAPALGR